MIGVTTGPREIVIVGGGTAGWMTAAALANFLPPACRIMLVESDEIGTIGVGESTIPQMTVFNQALGIDENKFVRETQATYKLGIQFDDWLRPGEGYFHSFGTVGWETGIVPFHHYWLRSRALGNRNGIAAYSAAALAAAARKFGKPGNQDRVARRGFSYAYHIDANRYTAYLREYAEQRGVVRREGRIVEVVQGGEDGRIVALQLADGTTLAGDFFFDCSGLAALLIAGKLDVPFEDWSHWLKCDRAWAVPSADRGPADPFTRATARRFGWQWRIPLQHRAGNGVVYSSQFADDEEVREFLLANLPGEPLQDPRQLLFRTGMRSRQWAGNCIAIGLSGGFLEPLEATSIYLIQSAIARALRYFPQSADHSAEQAGFNAEAAFEYASIRDFLILHYCANNRVGEPLWDACRTTELPDTLGHKLELFRSSGRIFRHNAELFDVSSWLQVMLGQGVEPLGYNPLADRIAPGELLQMLEETSTSCRNLAARLPAMEDYLVASGGSAAR